MPAIQARSGGEGQAPRRNATSRTEGAQRAERQVVAVVHLVEPFARHRRRAVEGDRDPPPVDRELAAHGAPIAAAQKRAVIPGPNRRDDGDTGSVLVVVVPDVEVLAARQVRPGLWLPDQSHDAPTRCRAPPGGPCQGVPADVTEG